MTQFVDRLKLTPFDRLALTALAQADGNASRAATLRRLLRQEARQRGLVPTVADAEGQAARQGGGVGGER
jgi:hypothetical protein